MRKKPLELHDCCGERQHAGIPGENSCLSFSLQKQSSLTFLLAAHHSSVQRVIFPDLQSNLFKFFSACFVYSNSSQVDSTSLQSFYDHGKAGSIQWYSWFTSTKKDPGDSKERCTPILVHTRSLPGKAQSSCCKGLAWQRLQAEYCFSTLRLRGVRIQREMHRPLGATDQNTKLNFIHLSH